ncbi:Cyclic di-AMP synthase CdaA [bioreactor metagenome]|uniref:Cyclic di-AMP synthase CdaA n=1 Tax=bioreactor metagenome TaxID=1076179 RepID=A0A645C7L1_9ZZZZ
MLDMVGRSRLTNSILFNFDDAVIEERINNTIDQVCQASVAMSNAKIGALIVIERETKIGEIISTGTMIDSEVTNELIRNVFYPKAPLHDGALIIRNNRIFAAGCFLPLSQQDGISRELGTRHRAALGMSEYSDALVVVVSEETGRISVAQNGTLIRNLTSKALGSILKNSLYKIKSDKEKKFKLWRWKA